MCKFQQVILHLLFICRSCNLVGVGETVYLALYVTNLPIEIFIDNHLHSLHHDKEPCEQICDFMKGHMISKILVSIDDSKMSHKAAQNMRSSLRSKRVHRLCS